MLELNTTSILSLASPWPVGLGRASRSAVRAVREAGPNASSVTFAASASERRSLLSLAGSRVDILHMDASTFYEVRAAEEENSGRRLQGRHHGASLPEPLLGTMGGYYTGAEIAREMSRLVATYPEWLAPAERVGTTRQGRAIEMWCLAPGGAAGCTPKSDRPAILFTSLVHSREPATLMCLVHALRTLLKEATENVAGVRQLLSARTLLWIPVANPDGYAWNERTRPRGGGMKRKNGAKCCMPPDTENDGIDLNRNFGFKWAHDNIGSSSRGCSEEYRGPSAFSEPETRAIRDVTSRFAVKSILHWHGWGNDVAFPYSYDWRAPMTNNDLGMYQEFATEMAAANKYASGRAWESVGYTTNGEADDWGWGDAKAVSITIEVGASSDGFWPPPSRILPIARESAWPAKYLAWASGPMLQLDTVRIEPGDDGTSARVALVVQNNGLLPFTAEHKICARGVAGQSDLSPSQGWSREEGTATILCVTLPALAARSYRALPSISLSWGSVQWVPLILTVFPTDISLVESAEHANLVAGSVDEAATGRRRTAAHTGAHPNANTDSGGLLSSIFGAGGGDHYKTSHGPGARGAPSTSSACVSSTRRAPCAAATSCVCARPPSRSASTSPTSAAPPSPPAATASSPSRRTRARTGRRAWWTSSLCTRPSRTRAAGSAPSPRRSATRSSPSTPRAPASAPSRPSASPTRRTAAPRRSPFRARPARATTCFGTPSTCRAASHSPSARRAAAAASACARTGAISCARTACARTSCCARRGTASCDEVEGAAAAACGDEAAAPPFNMALGLLGSSLHMQPRFREGAESRCTCALPHIAFAKCAFEQEKVFHLLGTAKSSIKVSGRRARISIVD